MKRLSLAVDLKLQEEQAGFRRERGCIDHIFTLKNITKHSITKTALYWTP